MKYCSSCAHPVALRIPAGDNLPRYVCDNCGHIHYQNPRIVAGAIPAWEQQVLLCRRAIEPRYGLWTLPAGFMENGETTEQAALRETREEACANVDILGIYSLISLPHVNQVYLMYRARLLDLDFAAGDESLEVRLFAEHEVPWDALAFSTIRHTLRHYFDDFRSGSFGVYSHALGAAPAR